MIRILSLILFLSICRLFIFGQQHSLIQYSVSEGLAQSQVSKIHQDSLGFLWAATSGGGVSRFDGKNFTNYNENDGLGGNIVTDITEGKGNTIYVTSTWGPVSAIQNNKTTNLSDNITGINHIIYDNKSERLYGAKENNLLYYADNKWESINLYSDEIIKGFFFKEQKLSFLQKIKL